jgi:hypothetical protein
MQKDTKAAAAPASGTEPVLACPEELLEPSRGGPSGGVDAKGLPEGCLKVYRDRELERFSGIISETGASKLQNQWHKPGAPYLDGAADDAPPDAPVPAGGGPDRAAPQKIAPGTGPPENAVTAASTPEEATARKQPEEESPYVLADRINAAENAVADGRSGRSRLGDFLDAVQGSRLAGAVDLTTLEVTALTMFRALFGEGVAIPVKREGLVDMDIVVMGKDIVLNTNRLMFELPELTIWRVIFSYKGQPILEYGRGIPHKLKVHKIRALLLLAGMWWHGLTSRNAQSERISGRALALMTKREQKKKARKKVRSD